MLCVDREAGNAVRGIEEPVLACPRKPGHRLRVGQPHGLGDGVVGVDVVVVDEAAPVEGDDVFGIAPHRVARVGPLPRQLDQRGGGPAIGPVAVVVQSPVAEPPGTGAVLQPDAIAFLAPIRRHNAPIALGRDHADGPPLRTRVVRPCVRAVAPTAPVVEVVLTVHVPIDHVLDQAAIGPAPDVDSPHGCNQFRASGRHQRVDDLAYVVGYAAVPALQADAVAIPVRVSIRLLRGVHGHQAAEQIGHATTHGFHVGILARVARFQVAVDGEGLDGRCRRALVVGSMLVVPPTPARCPVAERLAHLVLVQPPEPVIDGHVHLGVEVLRP